MTGFGVQVQLSAMFSVIDAEAYARKTPTGYEVVVKRSKGSTPAFEADCFNVFVEATDEIVRDLLLDPTKETIVWHGVVDIVPKDYTRLRGSHG